MAASQASSTLYGVLAEFERPEQLIEAGRRTREAGYTRFEAYAPHPVHGLSDAMAYRRSAVPALVLVGGLAGAAIGYALQYHASVIGYPLNVGGRPLHSWVAFIPVTFELTILLAALTGVIGMLLLNGLPRLYHPVFNVPAFERASQDRFFLCIEADDPRFDLAEARRFLEGLQPASVTEVPRYPELT